MKKIRVEDIDHLNFWINYIGCCYPNGYDESNDISVSELMRKLYTAEAGSWWEQFTGYHEDVFADCDGYLDDPTTLEEELLTDKILIIEFHPGDILYFINDEQIGSTGPHWELQTIPYKKIDQLLSLKRGRQLFLLLLPLAFIEGDEISSARENISKQLKNYFSADICESVSECIAAGLIRRI